MGGAEVLYTTLLLAALVMNGISISATTPLLALLAPVREGGLVARLLMLDLVLVPAVAVGLVVLLDLDDVTRAGLVIVAACSCGPIGLVLSRLAGGDAPLSVSLVVGFGALNLVTVPIVTGLLLPSGISIAPLDLVLSLLAFAIAPIVIGRTVANVASRRSGGTVRLATMARVAARTSDVLLVGVVATALMLEPRAVLLLGGPLVVVALAVMLSVAAAARLVTRDPERRRTVTVSVNARAVGLALTLAAVHLGDVEGLRATILAYGGLTQVVPLAGVLVARRLRPDGRVSVRQPG